MRLIIIRGPAGSGKSTIAKLLAATRDAALIHLDDELAADGGDEIIDGAIPLENFLVTLRRLEPRLHRDLKQRDVILDGCFYYRALLDALVDFRPCTFVLRAPLETCIERDARRPRPLGEKAVRDVWRLVEEVQAGIPVDATGSPESIAEKIAARL